MKNHEVLKDGGAHAASTGSLFVYYGSQKTILIATPEEKELIKISVYQQG